MAERQLPRPPVSGHELERMGATFGSYLPIPRDQSFAELLSRLDVELEPIENNFRVKPPFGSSPPRSDLGPLREDARIFNVDA